MSISAAKYGIEASNDQRRPTADPAGRPHSALARPSVCQARVKRFFDVAISLTALVIVSPLLLVISALIVLDSGRPVFFRQERVGARRSTHKGRVAWQERRFQILKFRTMVPDADSSPVHRQFIELFAAGKLTPDQLDRAGFKLRSDARITRIGRFLRASSLDELPQLFNVLRGTMSLVGPRPVPPYEVELYQPWQRERLSAIPGITGQWQVYGRGRVSFEEMIKLDIEYVRQQSLRRDLSLMLRTLPAVCSTKGAR